MRRITFLLLTLCIYSCSAQKAIKTDLLGEWELIVEENPLGDDEVEISISSSVTETEADDWKTKIHLIFKPNDSLYITKGDEVNKTTFEIQEDNKLLLGNTKFEIFDIDKMELILQQEDKRYIYRKKIK